MAFNPRQISPLDFQPSVGVGISLPFNQPGVFGTTYTTKDTIKANLVNYFLTNFGERPLNPNFGSNFQARLFEAINEDNLAMLEDMIVADIAAYFPQVVINQVLVNGFEDYNTIQVTIVYNVRNTNINDTLQFNFA